MEGVVKIIPIHQKKNFPKEVCKGAFLLQEEHVGLVHFDKNDQYKLEGLSIMRQALRNGCIEEANAIQSKLLRLIVSFK